MNILINMDGVIMKYKQIKDETGYYLINEPDNKMINVIEALCRIKYINLKIITNLSKDGKTYLKDVNIKKQWLKECCPFINIEKQFIATTAHIEDVINLLYNTKSPTYNDILICSTTKEVTEWQHKGGFAVKYETDTVYPNETEIALTLSTLTLTKDMASNEIYDLLKTTIDQFEQYCNDRKEDRYNEN